MANKERTQVQVLSHEEVQRKIKRIAHQLHEENFQEQEIVLVGIASRGIDLAKRLSKTLQEIGAFNSSVAELSFDKDHPLSSEPSLSCSIDSLENKVVVLVDDVLQSGRTLMHAATHLIQVPLKKLSTVVLVDRKHRSFPIRADIVGLTLSTTMQEHISVKFGSKDGVYLD